MKKLCVCILFFIPLFLVGALPQDALEQYLQRSLDHWDISAPWIRMGEEPYSGTLDPGEIILSIREDLAKKNRLEEFKYIFDYYRRMEKEGAISVGIVEELPPTPGFFPVRRDGRARGIVISRQDMALVDADPALFRSSFLRALTILVYLESNASFHTPFQRRNFMVELVSFMTGYHVEAIYLSEILNVRYPKGPSASYQELLLRSARENNLRELAFVLYSLDLDFIYNVINGIRKIENVQTAGNLLEYYSELPDMLAYDASRLSFLPEPNMGLVNKGSFIRSVTMTMPWLYLDLEKKIPSSFTDLREKLDSSYKLFDPVFYGFRYGDEPVLRSQIININLQHFRPPDPEIVAEISRENAVVAGATDPVRWYRYYDERGLFNPDPELEITREEAMAGAAFGVSRTEKDEVTGIMYRVQERPETDYFLDGVATIRIRREAGRETWFWKNEFGTVTDNSRGVAVMVGTRDSAAGGTVYRFYDRKGHAVRDASGAWMIRINEPEEGVRETVFLNAASTPIRSVEGYALERMILRSAEETKRYLYDVSGDPVMSWIDDFHYSRMTERPGKESIVREYFFYDTEQHPVSVPGQAVRERHSVTQDMIEVRLLDKEGGLMLCSAGFAIQRTVYEQGLLREIRFSNIENNPAYTIDGFSSVRYDYDEIGRIKSYSFYDIQHAPVACSSGYHRKEYSFEKDSLIREVSHFDSGGNPAEDEQNVFRIRLYLDENGNFDRAEAWDARGNLINAPSGGPGGAPVA